MKIRTLNAALLVLLFAVLPNVADADIHVDVYVGVGDPNSQPVQAHVLDSDQSIVLNNIPNTSAVWIRVWADSPLTEDVGHITLNNPFTTYAIHILFATSGG
jgi:hypothetical protein